VPQRQSKLFPSLPRQLAPNGLDDETASVLGQTIDLLDNLLWHRNRHTFSKHNCHILAPRKDSFKRKGGGFPGGLITFASGLE
jgi:hypothetical protein